MGDWLLFLFVVVLAVAGFGVAVNRAWIVPRRERLRVLYVAGEVRVVDPAASAPAVEAADVDVAHPLITHGAVWAALPADVRLALAPTPEFEERRQALGGDWTPQQEIELQAVLARQEADRVSRAISTGATLALGEQAPPWSTPCITPEDAALTRRIEKDQNHVARHIRAAYGLPPTS